MKHFFHFITSFRLGGALALAGALLVLPWAAEAANPVLVIQASGAVGGGGDVTAFVDQVEIVRVSDGTVVAGAVANPSFETNGGLTNGNYGYNPSGASWTFNTGSGIAQNGSNFGPTATTFGTYMAFLQSTPSLGNGLIQQTLALANGAYQVRFQVSQRNCCSTNDQRLNVLVDGVPMGSVLPANNGANSTFTSSIFVVGPQYEALPVAGYNADVVANGTNLPVSSTVTVDFDGAGYTLMEHGYSNNLGQTATQGLPPGGVINSAQTAGLPFQLASYSASNSLRLLGGGVVGTLTLAQPRAVNTLYVLAATGSGNTNMNVTVRYTDGSTDFFGNNYVPDWFGGGSYAILGLGRTTPGGGIDNNTNDPRLYQTTLTLSAAGRAKQIASVGFANANGGVLNVMGLSADVAPNLVISTAGQNVSGASYNSITVQSGGAGTLQGAVVVNSFVSVLNGGTLSTNCQSLTGAGTFTLAAGGTLLVCDPAGIAASGATGAVQLTGARSFSTDAGYVYNGVAAQSTGSGLPSQVRNLTTTNTNAVTLSAPTSVAQVLTVGGAGNLATGGQALTLLSSATGTALAVNSGTGVVQGPATVQRYVASTNTGPGYRHYSAPVANTTVNDLATAGFTPVVNGGYNASATPQQLTPFPTVFGYDQSRVTLTNPYQPFDRGFFSPAALTDPLTPGRGYAVNIGGTQLVDFVGTLNNGDQALTLARNAAGTANEAAAAGWQFLGNPYPAPLDYSLVAPADRTGLDAAIYVYGSTGPYVGAYRSYVNGMGGNPVLPVAQGFFARVSAGQNSATLTFRNAQRLTAPDATGFQRPATDPRPLVQLDLRSTIGATDAFYAYAEAVATPAFDPRYDALKLPNPTGLNLSSAATSGESLAIDGRPVFTATTALPLLVGVPAAGTYTITAALLANLPAGLEAYLSDAATGQTVNLRRQPTYAFAVTAAQAATGLSGRFVLHFAAASPLATAPALTAADVTLYPNPARDRFTVLVPATVDAALVQGTLLNALGQTVRQQATPATATGARLAFDTSGLPAGVYVLRLRAGNATLAKRIVLY